MFADVSSPPPPPLPPSFGDSFPPFFSPLRIEERECEYSVSLEMAPLFPLFLKALFLFFFSPPFVRDFFPPLWYPFPLSRPEKGKLNATPSSSSPFSALVGFPFFSPPLFFSHFETLVPADERRGYTLVSFFFPLFLFFKVSFFSLELLSTL